MGWRCTATTKAGKPCSAMARPGKAVCLWHDPDGAAERLANSRRGGEARRISERARKLGLREELSLDDVRLILGGALRQVLAGDIAPAVAQAAGTLGRAIVVVSEASDLERRIAELEALVGKEDAA